MRAEQRLWRTEDGRLVEDGHVDARILAYAPGNDIAAADQDKMPGRNAAGEPKPAAKRAPRAAKSRTPEEDK